MPRLRLGPGVLLPVSMPSRASWEKVREITCSRCRAKPYAAAPANAGTDGKSLRERCFLLAWMRRFRGCEAPRAVHRRLLAGTFAPPASRNFRETTQKCANGAGIGSPFLDMAPLKFAILSNPLTGAAVPEMPRRNRHDCWRLGSVRASLSAAALASAIRWETSRAAREKRSPSQASGNCRLAPR
jgi:hypothetical protein